MSDYTKTLWLLRHGDNVLEPDTKTHGVWQPNSPLSAAGRATIERVREAHLCGQHFAKLYTSPYRRAVETARIAVPDREWTELPTLAPRMPKLLDTLMAPLTTPPTTLEEVAKRWPDLLDVETAWMMESLDMALAELHLGEQALLVGHQPLIGLARGSWEPSKGPRFPLYEQTLPKGGIYKFTFVDPPWLELDLNMVECLLPPK